MAARYSNRLKLIEKIRRPLLDLPFQHLTLTGVARAAGVSMWAVRNRFENVENGIHAVARHLLDRTVASFSYEPQSPASVHGVIGDYAAFVASVMGSEDYIDLLSLTLRNGRGRDWLNDVRERELIERVSGRLEELVLDAGQQQGRPVLMRSGAARRFFQRLELEFAVPGIVRPGETHDPEASAKIMRDIVREAFEATYLFEWGEPGKAAAMGDVRTAQGASL